MSDIICNNLSRTYQSYKKPEGLRASVAALWHRQHIEVVALRPTTLQIDRGQIVGLVGANGAGKTTLLKMLSGVMVPSQGEAEVLGFVPWKREYKFLRQIALLLGQKNQLWWDVAAVDSFALLAAIYELDETAARRRVIELAEMLQCRHVLEIQLRRLSLGERMKMELIGALLHDPQVIFLDEPTIGLDVVAQDSIRAFLNDYVRTQKKTVILTSHYMDDIAQVSDRLLLISKGQIVYDGSVPDFVSRSAKKQILRIQFASAIANSFQLPNGQEIAAGSQSFETEVTPDSMVDILNFTRRHNAIFNIQLEEKDFEGVIREFLQQEAGR
jgi:ABC-2 type transport system ATP-binding protein